MFKGTPPKVEQLQVIVVTHVIGEGVVTLMDGAQMKHSNLAYRKDGELLGMFGVDIHVLPAGYKYDLVNRKPISPSFKELANAG